MLNTESDARNTADAIIAQLGGNKIFAMAFDAGASTRSAKHLMLSIAKPLRKMAIGKASHVTIILMPDDTYGVRVVRVLAARQSYGVDTLHDIDGVHAPELRATIERLTGLALTLGTMGA